MPLRIEMSPERVRPVVIRDQCGGAIAEARDGNDQWPAPQEPGLIWIMGSRHDAYNRGQSHAAASSRGLLAHVSVQHRGDPVRGAERVFPAPLDGCCLSGVGVIVGEREGGDGEAAIRQCVG